VWFALDGPQAGLAQRKGRVLRYHPDYGPFYGLPGDPGPQDWADAAALSCDGLVTIAASLTPFPGDWELAWEGAGVQMIAGEATGRDADPDPEIIRLGPGDADDALALVERTRPGPFRARTIEMGTYLGIRRDGVLVAMAGERIRIPGFCEISAICTDEAWRGHGLASLLTLAVAAGIRARGETPFLHAVATNTTAIRVYEHLGFTIRQETSFKSARVPA
jgi:ribosomal protein S18 acetylase RimI-like enzyme